MKRAVAFATALFGMLLTRKSGQRFDRGAQAALVTSGLVLVNDLLVGDRVDHADGRLIDGLSGSLVASFDGLLHFLDRGAQSRTQAHVVRALLDRLAGALASLCSICHIEIRLKNWLVKQAKSAIVQANETVCKPFMPSGLKPGKPANIATSRKRLLLMGGAADFP